jgi:hypothetical protein
MDAFRKCPGHSGKHITTLSVHPQSPIQIMLSVNNTPAVSPYTPSFTVQPAPIQFTSPHSFRSALTPAPIILRDQYRSIICPAIWTAPCAHEERYRHRLAPWGWLAGSYAAGNVEMLGMLRMLVLLELLVLALLLGIWNWCELDCSSWFCCFLLHLLLLILLMLPVLLLLGINDASSNDAGIAVSEWMCPNDYENDRVRMADRNAGTGLKLGKTVVVPGFVDPLRKCL